MIESRNTFVCEQAERASDLKKVFNSFTVKKVNFFTINVKFKVIFSSKSGGGGIFVQAIPPPPPKKVGGGDTSPHPPGIYASAVILSENIYFNIILTCKILHCHYDHY